LKSVNALTTEPETIMSTSIGASFCSIMSSHGGKYFASIAVTYKERTYLRFYFSWHLFILYKLKEAVTFVKVLNGLELK
jgi:hypothetical protein